MKKFKIENTCIGCGACDAITKDNQNFKLGDEDGLAYVNKQPETEVELRDCMDAMGACPVGAIKEID